MTTFRPMAARTSRPVRLPEQGRIRLGEKDPKRGFPKKLHTLRFTSPDRNAIDAVANLYGGTARAWQNGNTAEHEVITEAAEVPVVLPDEPLGGTPFYELWDRGGLRRRCDGVTATCPVRVNDNEVDYAEEPCVCNARERAECKVTTRLSVVLPDIPFGGTWRLETHSWNAADELPGMVEAVRQFANRGFVKAFLGVRQEEKVEAGKKKQWIVPYLRLADSVTAVLDGAAQVAALAPAAPRELGAASRSDDSGEGAPATAAGIDSQGAPPPPLSQKHQLVQVYAAQGLARCEAVSMAAEQWGDRPDQIPDVDFARLVEDAAIADAEVVE